MFFQESIMKIDIKNKSWRNFINLCMRLETEKQLANLFDLFLTNAEKEDIVTRYEIVAELLGGKITQREMAEKLQISIAKISRGSNAIKIADEDIKKIIRTISRPKK